ncbi:hypothetical protein PVAP13_3KG070346 [Panicum virgatum]|uniref:Uncharacterized protein n=1 Tax=Panicum virgatum TaxID=38727 RepID=A0A8T0UFC9_PANVG|nr:hypothetical protein PVAP13_3KG070346 [Panicum virgatum]
MIHLFPQQILLLYFSSQRIWILPIPLHFFLLPAVVAICLLRLLCVEVRDDDSSFVLIPFIFSPLRQHLGRWHRHRASRADGTVAADHFHRLLAANAPAAGTVVERRGRPLAPLAQATSYADPSVARPPPTPPPPASSAWRMAPSPLPASSACRTADGTHAITIAILLFFLRSVDILFFLCAAAATPSLLLPRVFYYWLLCWLDLHFRLQIPLRFVSL